MTANTIIYRCTFICFVFFIVGCKNYYNETIAWMDNIEQYTDISEIKENQPDFVKIDWNNPEKKGNENWYYIEIKQNHDILNMSHILVFINDKFDRRESHK